MLNKLAACITLALGASFAAMGVNALAPNSLSYKMNAVEKADIEKQLTAIAIEKQQHQSLTLLDRSNNPLGDEKSLNAKGFSRSELSAQGKGLNSDF